MIERDEERRRQQSQLDLVKAGEHSVSASSSSSERDGDTTPIPRHARLQSSSHQSETTAQPSPELSKDSLPDITAEATIIGMGDEEDAHASSALRRFLAEGSDPERADESTPLLGLGGGGSPKKGQGIAATLGDWKRRAGKLTSRDIAQGAFEPVKLLPATVLGLLLNVLDGVSYGMIL